MYAQQRIKFPHLFVILAGKNIDCLNYIGISLRVISSMHESDKIQTSNSLRIVWYNCLCFSILHTTTKPYHMDNVIAFQSENENNPQIVSKKGLVNLSNLYSSSRGYFYDELVVLFVNVFLVVYPLYVYMCCERLCSAGNSVYTYHMFFFNIRETH